MDLTTLNESCERAGIPPFESLIPEEHCFTSEHPTNLQVNVGYRCNLACTHCFLDCGPNRTECMSRKTMEDVLRAFEKHGFEVLDIIGNLMCTYQINVDYDGRIYECDSYHAVGAEPAMTQTIGELADMDAIPSRRIVFSPICYVCTAGAGSSCGGNTAE